MGTNQIKQYLPKFSRSFRKQLSLDALMIADSALYSADNLALMKELKWLCRVPLSVAYAKQLVSQLGAEEFIKSEIEGYRIAVKNSNYGGVEQRWLVVESEARREAELRQLEKRVSKSETTAQKKLQKLCAEKFACHQDAMQAASHLSQQIKYHQLTEIKTIKSPLQSHSKTTRKSRENQTHFYQIQAKLERELSGIETEKRRAGRFVLATNVLDVRELSHNEMLSEYKAQQASERGFGFLKDPLFFSDSVFLKSPERIEALAMCFWGYVYWFTLWLNDS